MAAPTSNNEVTARRLTRLLTGSDGNGGLWGKVKDKISSSINALDVSSVGGAGKYISAISETDGKISATATTMDTTPTASSTNAVTSGGVKTALDGKLNTSGGAMTGAITRDLGTGVISDTNLLTVSGSTDGFKVDYGAATADAGVTKIYTTDDANAKISIGNKISSTYNEAISVINGNTRIKTLMVSNGDNNSGYGVKILASMNFGTNYANWDSSLKDGAHFREWRISLPSMCGRLRLTLSSYWYNVNSGGSLSKTFSIYTSGANCYCNDCYYDSVGGAVANEFRISDLVWNSTESRWEIIVHSILPNSDNSIPYPIIEWYGVSTDAYKIETVSGTPTIVTDTSYTNTKRNITVPWSKRPLLQTVVGDVFDTSMTVPIANGGTGATQVTGSNGALHNLTNDQIGTASQWFLTITNSWNRCGYCSVADAKTVLGLKGAAFLDTGTASGTVATGNHTHGNISNTGTLTDTAAAAAGNDYVVIRDADNAKIQTSTIKGTDVADAVSKKHSHSTLTLSTTAQAYDGSHTLALPSTDPYTSARTPSSHASSATTYGVGTTANYGHVKLVTGDLNGQTAADGSAASNAHTHSQYSTTSHTHSSITTVGDKRNVAPTFSDYSNKLVFQGLKTNTVLNTPYSGYSYLVGLRGWSDASGGKTHELAFNDSGVFHRTGDASSYGTWAEVLTERYTGNKSNFRTIPQDMSKGANLVVNGQGLMMNNYNWPDFTYDGVTCYNGSSGTFYKSGSSNGVKASTEFISVDCNKKITFSADVRYTGWSENKYIYLCALVYDIDKKEIQAVHTMYGAGTLTTLAQALNPGDTKIYLTSVANWSTSISQTYLRGFIFWNYTNSKGYTYPPETYSRNVYSNWFDSASNIDTTNNTITLNKAWTGPAIPAGTKVSKCASGGNYLYVSSRNITVAENGTWFTLKGSIKGFVTTGNNPTQFRQGTAFVKPGFLFYGTTGTEFRFTNYKVYEVPEDVENAVTATKIVNNISAGSATNLLYGTVAGSDYYRVRAGGDSNNAWLEIATADDGTEPIYIRQYTGAFATVTRTATILDGSGNTTFPGNVTATKFIGAVQGNADTATKLATTRELAVNLANTSTTSNFDGSANQTGIKVSGTLGVANGGTGITTVTNVNSVLIGNSSSATGAMQTVATASGAFYATAANAKPSFGTLPVAQGGTGQTSLANVTVGKADYPTGFGSRPASISWGTLTSANGYTYVSDWRTASAAEISFAEKSGALYTQIDGVFYQREGGKRVLDVSDINSSFYAPTAGGTANYVLIGQGATSAPTWAEKAPKATTADTATSVNVTAATTTMLYLTGVESTGNSKALKTDTGIYAETTSGSLRATQFNIAGQCVLNYDTTTSAVYFTFN